MMFNHVTSTDWEAANQCLNLYSWHALCWLLLSHSDIFGWYLYTQERETYIPSFIMESKNLSMKAPSAANTKNSE